MAHIAYIGLGANLDERAAAIEAAISKLKATSGVLSVDVSSLYETEPVGGPAGQGAYLNAAARVTTTLGPHELLRRLLEIEAGLGRVRHERWGPRTIDLDLLLYDELVLETAELRLPHPRMHERRFVLEPLNELAPDASHPVLKSNVGRLLAGLG